MKKSFTLQLEENELIIETGEIAKQANGSVLLSYGDSSILTAVTMGKDESNQDFFPLSVHYGERYYAVGKIPGGFYKREGKPRDKEVLISRVIDRSIRPLFAEGFRQEVQIIPMVIESDQDNPTDVLALNSASIALMISDIPFHTPVSAVRVGKINGNYILNPTFEQIEKGQLDLTVAGTKENIVMIEGGADRENEESLVGALEFAHKHIIKICDFQEQIAKEVGKEKININLFEIDEEIKNKVYDYAKEKIYNAIKIIDKLEKYEKLDEAKNETKNHFGEILDDIDDDLKKRQLTMVNIVLEQIEYEAVRESVLEKETRIDGRKCNEIRDITARVGLFKRTHGSSLFTRGETQAMCIATLGTSLDEQRYDDLEGEGRTNFMLHYNFPPFSVGETGRIGSPGRREIGHGKLAERALSYLLPNDNFPYTIRLVSEIMESNGSSSMATVCAGSLALYDAGVPMKEACAGISIGLISEEGFKRYKIITDIQGLEDHMGDMDFKVAGTKTGITSVQLDIKLYGVPIHILKEGFEQAKIARTGILDYMESVMAEPKPELSPFAPKIIKLVVKKEKIKDIIGPGGKIIKGITEKTGANVIIDDNGEVTITSKDEKSATDAYKMVQDIVEEVETGKIYEGTVTKVMHFGAFVEILPGKEGLCPIQYLSNQRIRKVTDVVNEGDRIVVKVKNIDYKQGRITLVYLDTVKKAK